jgi:hypothetical protein
MTIGASFRRAAAGAWRPVPDVPADGTRVRVGRSGVRPALPGEWPVVIPAGKRVRFDKTPDCGDRVRRSIVTQEGE